MTFLKIRLKGGRTHGFISRGVLEVKHQGEWGAVCSEGWNKDDAYVACGQLGYPDIKVLNINTVIFMRPFRVLLLRL